MNSVEKTTYVAMTTTNISRNKTQKIMIFEMNSVSYQCIQQNDIVFLRDDQVDEEVFIIESDHNIGLYTKVYDDAFEFTEFEAQIPTSEHGYEYMGMYITPYNLTIIAAEPGTTEFLIRENQQTVDGGFLQEYETSHARLNDKAIFQIVADKRIAVVLSDVPIHPVSVQGKTVFLEHMFFNCTDCPFDLNVIATDVNTTLYYGMNKSTNVRKRGDLAIVQLTKADKNLTADKPVIAFTFDANSSSFISLLSVRSLTLSLTLTQNIERAMIFTHTEQNKSKELVLLGENGNVAGVAVGDVNGGIEMMDSGSVFAITEEVTFITSADPVNAFLFHSNPRYLIAIPGGLKKINWVIVNNI